MSSIRVSKIMAEIHSFPTNFCHTYKFISEFQQFEHELCSLIPIQIDSEKEFPLNLVDYFTEQKKQHNCISYEMLDKFKSDCHYLHAVYLCANAQVFENEIIELPVDIQQFKLNFATILTAAQDSHNERSSIEQDTPLFYPSPLSFMLPDCIRKCLFLGTAGLITAGVATGIRKHKRR